MRVMWPRVLSLSPGSLVASQVALGSLFFVFANNVSEPQFVYQQNRSNCSMYVMGQLDRVYEMMNLKLLKHSKVHSECSEILIVFAVWTRESKRPSKVNKRA